MDILVNIVHINRGTPMTDTLPTTSGGYTAPEGAVRDSDTEGRTFETIVSQSSVPGVVEGFGLMNQLVPVLNDLDGLLIDGDITPEQDYEIDTLMLMLVLFFDRVSERMSRRAINKLVERGSDFDSLLGSILGEN